MRKEEKNSMQTLTRALSIEDIQKGVDKNNRIEGVVTLTVDEVITNDYQTLLDTLSTRLTGSTDLDDLDYAVVKHTGDASLCIRVSGDARRILSKAS